jgi:glutamate-5-semialdehyde dehydrogenase
MRALAEQAREAATKLATSSTQSKDDALHAAAKAVRTSARAVIRANARDLKAARSAGKPAAFLDRLALDEARVESMAEAIDAVAALPDPVGEVVETRRRPNGLRVEKVRLPLGVVLMVYEARPNVTSDAAALCLKSGNAALLRGGRDAVESNRAIAACLSQGLASAGLPMAAVQLVPSAEHAALLELLQLEGLVDLCIPRGGEGLIRFVAEHARMPVVKHYKGVCHVYVHASADLGMAEQIILDAKADRPGVCNAAECLLVDRGLAGRFLPRAGRSLAAAGVELRGCPTTVTLLKRAGVPVKAVAPDDYGREFLDLILAVRVVRDLDQALEHIRRYGSEHTEAIVTDTLPAAERFCREVAASGVMVNASTRFNDGAELGLGAEIGISTTRLHAFGPMGLKELTAQKFVVRGAGQTRGFFKRRGGGLV